MAMAQERSAGQQAYFCFRYDDIDMTASATTATTASHSPAPSTQHPSPSTEEKMSRSQAPPSILDRPLGRPASSSGGRGSSGSGDGVSLSAFAYLYSELVQYHQSRVASISELERRLESAGYGVGLRVLELLAYRAREVRLWWAGLLVDT